MAKKRLIYPKKCVQIRNDSNLTITQLKRIVKIGLLVNRKIRHEGNAEIKRMCEYADFHIMTALYKMHDYIGLKYRRIVNALRRIIRFEQQRLGEEFSYNKVFTKSDRVWLSLKQRL